MGNRNKQSNILGEIIVLIILILLIFLTNVKTEKLSYIESAVHTIVNPIQKIALEIKNKIQGNSTYFLDLEELKSENEELKQKNSELELQLRELENIKAENNTLEEYMNLTQKYSEYDTVPAYVIDKDISNYSNDLIINVGSDDGVEVDMTVIADKGLVGHVISVTKNTSKVQIIADSASAVSCNISTTDQTIICKGTLEDQQILRISYIPSDVEIIQGDNVYTSGIGGIYSKGILIGTIEEIITTNNLTDRYAKVRTAVDFSNINGVLVIKN